MADYDSSLPVRTENNGDVVSKLCDGTTNTQVLEINSDKQALVEVHGNNPAGTDETLRLSELGHGTLDGKYDGTNNTDPSNVGLIAHTRAATPADSDQVKRLTAKTGTTDTDVHALDVSIHDANGNSFSISNPLPVWVAENPGTEVQDFDQASSVAAEGTANHDYSVANGKTFILRKIHLSASGKLRGELQIGDGANPEVFTTKMVGFNSTAEPNCPLDLDGCPITVVGTANTTTIRVIKKNEDKQAQDLYSTILGIEN